MDPSTLHFPHVDSSRRQIFDAQQVCFDARPVRARVCQLKLGGVESDICSSAQRVLCV